MGSGNRESGRQTDIYNRAANAYDTMQPSPVTGAANNAYLNAVGNNDYGNVMSGYNNYMSNIPNPTQFTNQTVSNQNPAQLGTAYKTLESAIPGYSEFASTGGYSPQDIQELRARGTSPIRAAYGNTMMQMDRARELAGGAGAPNYIAAVSKASRQLPGQLADAMTGVNAQLAEDIRSGKLAGLSGLTSVGGQEGGLASQEAGRNLSASLANQQADLERQGMTEGSLQNSLKNRLAGLAGMTSLYGTTPAQAALFGNQALAGQGQQNQYGLGLLGAQEGSLNKQSEGTPWWQTALKVAGTVAPYAAMAFSSKELKHDIKPLKNVSAKLKELPIYTWKYKGENTKHMGPIAEDFKKKFGIGDGKTLHLADVMGVIMASRKEELAHA